MLFAENITALIVTALCIVVFVLGYALRDFVDGARADWNAYTYRERSANNGRR